MNGCDEVRDILVAEARGEGVSGAGQRFLREHTENCPRCRTRLENERKLSAGLAAVATASNAAPSPAVRVALMAEFRRQRKVMPIRRVPAGWVAAAAVAAALLLGVWLAKERGAREIETPKAPVVTVTAPPPIAPPALALVRPAIERDRRPTRRVAVHAKSRPVPRRPEAPVEETDEVATDFFEIPYAEPLRPHERADVFRVQMPRANMAVFGLPVMGGRLDSNVTADVLMGEDGVVRAIRFVR